MRYNEGMSDEWPDIISDDIDDDDVLSAEEAEDAFAEVQIAALKSALAMKRLARSCRGFADVLRLAHDANILNADTISDGA